MSQLDYLRDKRDKLCNLPQIDEHTQFELDLLNERISELLNNQKRGGRPRLKEVPTAPSNPKGGFYTNRLPNHLSRLWDKKGGGG